jgi:hypothetical protein
MRFLSLGAGVQSSTLLLMMCRGDLPKADHAIFADTGWEPKTVYAHLEWLKVEAAKADIPVHVVSYGDIRGDSLNAWLPNDSKPIGHSFATLPFFTLWPDGKKGMLQRQCTNRYKIHVIDRKMREILGVDTFGKCAPGSVEQYFGISADEKGRTRESNRKAIKFYYPFIWHNSSSDRPYEWRRPGITRADCLNWCKANGYPTPPRSACIGCPYHSNREWREMRDTRPEDWADAVAFDKAIRHPVALEGTCYLHADRVPLDEADLDNPDPNQGMLGECEGMCGL